MKAEDQAAHDAWLVLMAKNPEQAARAAHLLRQRLVAVSRIVRRALASHQLEKLEDAKPYLDDAEQPTPRFDCLGAACGSCWRCTNPGIKEPTRCAHITAWGNQCSMLAGHDGIHVAWRDDQSAIAPKPYCACSSPGCDICHP